MGPIVEKPNADGGMDSNSKLEDEQKEEVNIQEGIKSPSPSEIISRHNHEETIESKSPTAPINTLPSGTGVKNNASNNLLRRNSYSPAFKQSVLEAFSFDPDCVGNQRATARKFGIHRRQVQKWLTQLENQQSEQFSSSSNQEGSGGSTYSTSTLGTSPYSSEKLEEPVQEPVAKYLQVDLSPSSSSSNNSSKTPIEDLSNMSSATMAMSLNLSLNSGANIINPESNGSGAQKQYQNIFHRSENNTSPIISKQPTTSTSIMSPTSLLSKFYSHYNYSNFSNNQPPSTTGTKHQGLNGDSPKSNSSNSNGNTNNLTPPNSGKVPSSQRNSTRNINYVNSHAQYLLLLDEIASTHPQDDYSLLRQALIRNEVSFTKVSTSTPKSSFFPDDRIPENGNNGWGNMEKRENLTNSPTSMSPNNQSNLALELFRHQNEYMKLVQQSGGFGLSDLNKEGIKTNGNTIKYPWLHPLAQAAAANLGLQQLMVGNINGQKKTSPPQHVFISPKPPNKSKPKTVAAALAASRTSPNSLETNYDSNGIGKKRSTDLRKRGKANRNKKPSCTITRPNQHEEDYVDPTSMLEITTGSFNSESSNSNGYKNMNPVNGTHFLHPFFQSQDNNDNEGNRNLDSPECAEMKKYMEQLERKYSIDGNEPDAEQITKSMALEAFTYDHDVAGDCRAVARKFGLNVRVVMKWIKESANKINTPPQTMGFQNNYTGSKLPVNGNSDTHYPNYNSLSREQPTKTNGDIQDENMHTTKHLPTNHHISSSNKRKTSKPNQICDFQQEDDDDLGFGDVPLDMMIPIKKRRVSSQQ